LERVVDQGNRLMDDVDRNGVGLSALRRPGAQSVYVMARQAAEKVLDSQLRIDEAQFKAKGESGVVERLLARLAAHDQGKGGE
jgi:hypothetical protein